MRKLAVTINNLSCGGTERQVTLIVNSLSDYYDVTLLLLSADKEEKLFFLPEINKNVRVKNCTTIFTVGNMFKYFWHVLFNKYHIAINFNDTGNLVGSVFQRIGNPKSEIYNSIRGNKRLNYRYISIWKYFISGVITNSSEIKDVLQNSYKIKKPVHVINNGIEPVELEKSLKNDTKKKVVLSVGRINPVKNHFDIIYLAKSLEGFEFLLIGDIHYQELLSLMSKLDVNNVRFLGAKKDLMPFYKQADMLVISSISEGFPNVLLEAINYEIPIISTSVGQIPFVLTDGKDGFLYEAGDTEKLIRLASGYFLFDVNEKNEMKREIQKLKSKYDINKVVGDLVEVFEN